MIIIYIARSVGKPGHIVSQLANDLLVFHKNGISFTLISPCDFKIDLRLELLGLSNNANSGSLPSMYKTLAAVISVDLESNLFTTHLTTKTITNSSCEICEKEGGEAVGGGSRGGAGIF